MLSKSVVFNQKFISIETTIPLYTLEEDIKDNRELLIQHKRNLLKLQNKKAIYAAGEEPLNLDNQIYEETKHVERVKSLLRDHFYRKLMHLVSLADLSSNEIGVLYRQCRPKNLSKQLPQPESYFQLVDLLWQMRDIHDNETPILELVEQLATMRRTLPLEQALRTWQSEVLDLGLLTIQSVAITEIEQSVNSADHLSSDSALLVEIMLDPGSAPDDYLVRMYYWENGTGDRCWYKQENDESGFYNRKHKLCEIPNLLHRILSKNEEKPASIEFLLPTELLVEAVDQWVSDNDPVKFCSEHRIVIRSQERIAKPGLSKWRQAWREKWKMFQTLKDARDIYWVESLGANEVTKLAERLIRAKEKAICLGLTFLPVHQANDQEYTSVLRHILRAGVPIMAWSRNREGSESTPQSVRDELMTILCKEYLDNLPIKVAELRQRPEVEFSEHLGNRFALFWDDPDRIPEAYKW